MTEHRDILKSLILSPELIGSYLSSKPRMEDLAELYVNSAFFSCAVKFIEEEHWVKKNAAPFKAFINSIKSELAPLDFLVAFVGDSSLKQIKEFAATAVQVETEVISYVKKVGGNEIKSFAIRALRLMTALFEFEHDLDLEKKSQGLHLGLSMYRTFDRMDEIFELTYSADSGMKVDLHNKERLYEGAGVGVQSGYSTILLALLHLNAPRAARIVDLGSGYGRVGLVVGLLRPDMSFQGYEFVKHRVEISKQSTARFGLGDHVHFHTQDLSLVEFKIPEADIYYMYDPFSEETYKHVLDQLILFSRSKQITIVTKGNARNWLLEVVRREGWPDPTYLDSSNLCLFRSQF